MKKFLLKSLMFAMVLSATFTLRANPVDVNTAERIGKKFLENSVNYFSGKSNMDCSHVYTMYNEQGEPVLYVFNTDNYDGFVIVSAEDCVSPILGYSYENKFNYENISDNLQYILGDYKATIEHVRTNKIAATAEIKAQWQMVKDNGRVTAKGGKSVEPLCQTTWDQSALYNDLCPEDPDGPNGHVYAGCVATAMGQIMKFWNFPAQGSGSHTYYPYEYGTQMADFANTFYNFQAMPLALTEESTEEEIFQVAQLLWHCGISVNMDYSPDGSGAYSSIVPNAIINYFHYDDGATFQLRDETTNWDLLLRNDLNDGMPVYYSGSDDYGQGGHAFVCDGYDDNNMFHFNLGWSGYDNGYYPSNAINTENGPYFFNSWQGAIFGMKPDEEYVNMIMAPTNFTVTPAANNALSATLAWTTPSYTMSIAQLTGPFDIVVERNGEILTTLQNANPNETMTYTDNTIPENGGYYYEVYVVKDNVEGMRASQMINVGPTCPLTFHMHDSWGDGWNEAYISVRNSAGGEIATVTIDSPLEELTTTIDIPTGEITFVWVEGNYDSECSFEIENAAGDIIFQDESPEGGELFTYNNACGNQTLMGDANNDGQINIIDVQFMVNYIYDVITPEEINLENADFNEDGVVDVTDITQLVNHIVGM